MKTIKKTIVIHASNEKVWNILTDDKYTRQWYGEFSPGSHAQTDWQVGSKAIFTDDSGGGMIAKITESRPREILAMEYTGVLVKNEEDYDSDEAKKYAGGKEIYVISQKNDATQLDIASDMSDEMYDIMSAAWDKALLKIKELAEK